MHAYFWTLTLLSMEEEFKEKIRQMMEDDKVKVYPLWSSLLGLRVRQRDSAVVVVTVVVVLVIM